MEGEAPSPRMDLSSLCRERTSQVSSSSLCLSSSQRIMPVGVLCLLPSMVSCAGGWISLFDLGDGTAEILWVLPLGWQYIAVSYPGNCEEG